MSQFTFEVTDANFQDEVLKSDTPVLVDFWAEWCGPCKMIAPSVDELAKKYDGKLRVGKMDVDMQPGVAEALGIQGIPTLILFKGGQPVTQVVGYRTKDQLDAAINRYLEPERA
jgi:thioredoxin 1